jgi:hypothetical protein
MDEDERIVAIGLLTEKEFRTLGQDLKQIYPVSDDHQFDDLLAAIERVTQANVRGR